MIKPYRIINASEFLHLHEFFSHKVHTWSTKYCMTPLSIHLQVPPKNYCHPKSVLIMEENRIPIAFISDDYLPVLNQTLFGDKDNHFNESSQHIFSQLLVELFQTKECSIKHAAPEVCDWIYPGSTSLLLSLKTNQTAIELLLHYQFVYALLPAIKSVKISTLSSLDNALEDQLITCQVTLNPIKLSISQLLELHPGDVITTDHHHNNPLHLRHKQHFAAVELRESEHHKSIIIKESI
ncbi:MAG TPA: FliM/FliN family flagellar motor C-terminal domain-containing protein [Legionella sp.]|nr:FliM/FliN family flagellar motor C-terminal domain-containing protein [Legionella sp.]